MICQKAVKGVRLRKRPRSLREETCTQRDGNKRRTTLSRGRVWGCKGGGESAKARKGVDRPTGVCKEASQALIGNLADCQLQTNRKSRATERERVNARDGEGEVESSSESEMERERSWYTSHWKGNATTRPTRISQFLDNTIRTVLAFRSSFSTPRLTRC